MKNAEKILHVFLVENKLMTDKEFTSLNEDVKIESIRVLTNQLLKNILDNVEDVNTAPIDQTRGDIKLFRSLQDIQQAIKDIQKIIENTSLETDETVKSYITQVILAIYNLNKYSSVFKDAYRNRKTILILRYQSVLMSVISAVAYLFSTLIDFSNNTVKLRERIHIEETTPYRTLVQFNNSCTNNEFKIITEDIETLRTFYNEVSLDNMTAMLEATDMFNVVIDSLQNLYRSLDHNGKTTNLIYKAAGVIVALISVREIFNMIYRSKYTIQDTLNNIKNFVHLGSTSLSKLLQFSSRYRADVEENSRFAQRDITQNNKDIAFEIKELPEKIEAEREITPEIMPVKTPSIGTDDLFF